MTENLNKYQLEGSDPDRPSFVDNSVASSGGDIQVYFRNIEQHLLEHIAHADVVLGCVAWLTSEPILRALATKKMVAIVVQKEDFLRPDVEAPSNFAAHLRSLYRKLRCDLDRYLFGNCILGSTTLMSDPVTEAVRCVGNHNAERRPAFPRMHNKFLLFGQSNSGVSERPDCTEEYPFPLPFTLRGVWTGSFNLTRNATASLENVLYLTNPSIVSAYYREWGQIYAMSEPLSWESEWVAPEWRIGT